MLSIQTNVNSMNAQENLRVTNDFQGRTISRLTSGFRINQSGDDAAGLAVANKFRSDIAELQQGVRNANDGLSTLQIIDGGLNNISKILDRLKTLATQSASTTFQGDRNTLDDEFQSLLTEIDRQAANIGLGTGDANAGRNNLMVNVYIGGGSSSSNSKVAVDLSGATNRVNSTQLGLSGLAIKSSTVVTDLASGSAGAFTSSTPSFLNGNSTQQFHFATSEGERVIDVVGDSDGLTGTEIITQLNQGLAGTGLSVATNSDGSKLQIASNKAFAFYADAAVNGGTQITAAGSSTTATQNLGKYSATSGALTTVADESKTFTLAVKNTTTSAALTVAVGDTADVQTAKAKAAYNAAGVDVLRLGNTLYFQGDKDFTITRGADADTSDPWGSITAASGSVDATDASGSTDATAGATNALAALATAVTSLGKVQGSIGTGQNRLSYAIQLAQSQITNFSAAESRIRDADVALEAANLTKAQVLQQASMAALAQANSAPSALISLLRG